MSGNNIKRVVVTADLSAEPVTPTEVKTYGNIPYSDYDELIATLITVARQQLEAACGRSFGIKTIECDFMHNGRSIRLPEGPVNEITALQYREEWCCGATPNWEDVLANTDDWELQGDSFKGAEGEYKVTYTTTDDAATELVKTAIKAQTIFLLESRADEKQQPQICAVAKALIFPQTPGDLLL